VKFYGDWVEICEDFASNFGDKSTDYYSTSTQRLTFHF
jgi:hypothetical protein